MVSEVDVEEAAAAEEGEEGEVNAAVVVTVVVSLEAQVVSGLEILVSNYKSKSLSRVGHTLQNGVKNSRHHPRHPQQRRQPQSQ